METSTENLKNSEIKPPKSRTLLPRPHNHAHRKDLWQRQRKDGNSNPQGRAKPKLKKNKLLYSISTLSLGRFNTQGVSEDADLPSASPQTLPTDSFKIQGCSRASPQNRDHLAKGLKTIVKTRTVSVCTQAVQEFTGEDSSGLSLHLNLNLPSSASSSPSEVPELLQRERKTSVTAETGQRLGSDVPVISQ